MIDQDHNLKLNMACSSKKMKLNKKDRKTNDILDMSLLCRICGATSDYLIPIFEGEGLENDLCKKISDYLPIKVISEDLLPEQMCQQCSEALLAWHDLVQCCLQADVTLRIKLKERHKKQSTKKRKKLSVTLEESIQKSNEETALSTTERKRRVRRKENAEVENEIETKQEVTEIISEEKESIVRDLAEDSFHDYVSAESDVKNTDEEFSADDMDMKQDEEEDEPTLSNYTDQLQRDRNSLVSCHYCKLKVVAKKLIKHLGEHAVEKTHVCDQCGNRYMNLSGLERHRHIVHSHVQKYICDHCQMTFHSIVNIQTHMNVHYRKCLKICEYCGKTFHNVSQYFHHRKKHRMDFAIAKAEGYALGEKRLPFQCSVCFKKFGRKVELKNHSLMHLRDKPHGCPHCHRKYKVKGRLIIHLKHQHPDHMDTGQTM